MAEDVSASLNKHVPRRAIAVLSAIQDGGCVEAEATVDGDAESLVLRRDGDDVRAWFNVCPHAGRRLDWAPGEFLVSKEGLLVCAAHGASFELVDGLCVAGPCRGESLRRVAVVVREGAVYVVDDVASSPSG